MNDVIRVDPSILPEVRKYGDFDDSGCFNCGSCTVSCSLSKEGPSFPRRSMRYVIHGLRDKLRSGLEPWLCYYCGDCAAACPQEAEPGESMMTLRRWLTVQYDWTGLSAKLYTSTLWEIGALLVVGAFVVILALIFHGPLVTEQVELTTFAPVGLVHLADLILLVTLSFFLLSNAFRMYWFTMHQGSNVKIPLRLYVTELKSLFLHAATQLRFRECANKARWLKHLLLVSGYALMFALVIVFLEWFQTDNIYVLWHPQRWLGYYATAVLIFCTVEILISRLKKLEEMHRFSHLSDWMFPILLLLTVVSGIAVHLCRYLGLPLATYYIYVIHLAIAVPMLVIEVPFGKWAHLAYRPLAVYFQNVQERAQQLQMPQETVPGHLEEISAAAVEA